MFFGEKLMNKPQAALVVAVSALTLILGENFFGWTLLVSAFALGLLAIIFSELPLSFKSTSFILFILVGVVNYTTIPMYLVDSFGLNIMLALVFSIIIAARNLSLGKIPEAIVDYTALLVTMFVVVLNSISPL